MKVTEGDLIQLALAGEFDVIIHGCNCFCTMGAGIALSIKRVFPEAYQADLATESGDRSKLGTISWATHIREGRELIIVNGYTQYHWKGRGVKVDYEAVDNVFKLVQQEFTGKRIGYPAIGAGLAGGDWQKIEEIIREALAGEDHTFVKYKP